MKAKNRHQRLVVDSAKSLQQSLPERVMRWAIDNALNHFAYRLTSGRTTCMDCGHEFVIERMGRKACVCPHCGTRLQVKETKERSHKEHTYFTYITTHKGFQVLRAFRLDVVASKASRPQYSSKEVCQYWIDEKGKMEVIGLRQSYNGYYYDSFCYSHPMELRQDDMAFQRVVNCFICPRMKILPVLKKHGFYGKVGNNHPVSLFVNILTDSRMETLMKQHQLDVINYFSGYRKGLDDYWASYKIAVRNHYEIKDLSMWTDLLGMLKRNGKDICNAYYICPADLKAEHDRWMKKIEERERNEKRDKERRTARAEESNFVKMKGRFFGLEIKDELLTISVLDSVQAHFDEGNAMHHCVGQMAYYSNPDSLILSAQIDGKRIETVELSLKTLKVLQSRGVCNQSTEYHDRIVNLVNSNAGLVAKRMAV